MRASQAIIFGPQNPFWIGARLSLLSFTPTNITANKKCSMPKAKFTLCTAAKPKQAFPAQLTWT